MSYYFDYIIKIEDFDKVICYYTKNNMRVFTFMMFHAELLLVQSHKVDGEIKCLALFGPEKYDFIFGRIVCF